MRPPICPACGAFMQEIRLTGETMYRCPWANPRDWRGDTERTPPEIYCNSPLKGQRVTGGGITIESVR